MIKISHISMDNPLYEQEVALRTSVLLDPIGFTFDDYLGMAPGREEESEHYVATLDHPTGIKVVGTATLFISEDNQGQRTGKVQQVCVDPQRQGEGIGRRLMIAMEARGFGELGLEQLYCHAQLSAMPFYERLGWQSEDEVFVEAGIEHKRMYISAPKPVDQER
ncbi:MAG: GNAT family N-acetyltransferase [Phycisphaerales bacterium]|nr:GNAT family N-acetyltransferase [Phycisphaerales bacterium]